MLLPESPFHTTDNINISSLVNKHYNCLVVALWQKMVGAQVLRKELSTAMISLVFNYKRRRRDPSTLRGGANARLILWYYYINFTYK